MVGCEYSNAVHAVQLLLPGGGRHVVVVHYGSVATSYADTIHRFDPDLESWEVSPQRLEDPTVAQGGSHRASSLTMMSLLLLLPRRVAVVVAVDAPFVSNLPLSRCDTQPSVEPINERTTYYVGKRCYPGKTALVVRKKRFFNSSLDVALADDVWCRTDQTESNIFCFKISEKPALFHNYASECSSPMTFHELT